VDRRGHILSGCSACEYRVHFGPAGSAGLDESSRLPSESQESA
jgi:hypothetical protein